MKPARLRQVAERDVEQAFSYYLQEAGPALAVDFIAAVDAALARMAAHPAAGSPRYAEQLDLPCLRSWLVERFPYVALYVECDDHIDVLRVLHQQQDIPAHMQA
ncbi:MAG TPA: type II toxin-antitoxin system RelE/ParE family toxin [Asticcacaulis sp.]